jgi:hypothetical protein
MRSTRRVACRAAQATHRLSSGQNMMGQNKKHPMHCARVKRNCAQVQPSRVSLLPTDQPADRATTDKATSPRDKRSRGHTRHAPACSTQPGCARALPPGG